MAQLMINWQFYPKSTKAPAIARTVIDCFELVADEIESGVAGLNSNAVLGKLCPHLMENGFLVETGKKASEKIPVPVLYGRNGQLEKSFDADALHMESGFVLEVEAGRGVANNQFLKDLFQACMMSGVHYLGIAVCNLYGTNKDFDNVCKFFDAMYASDRLELPLKGILLIGY